MDTDGLIKNLKPIYAAVADANKIREELSFVSVAALANGSNEPVNLVLSNGEIILRCESAYSEANSPIPANVTKETPENGFFYDIISLTKLFQVLSGRVKIEIDSRGFLLIKTRNEVYAQSPLRDQTKKTNFGKQEKEKTRAKGTNNTKEKKAA